MKLIFQKRSRPRSHAVLLLVLHVLFVIKLFVRNWCCFVDAFPVDTKFILSDSSQAFRRKPTKILRRQTSISALSANSRRLGDNEDFGSRQAVLQARLEEQRRAQIIQAVLQLDHSDSQLQSLHLVGQARLPAPRNRTVSCAVLALSDSAAGTADTNSNQILPCLLVPLKTESNMKLLEFAVFNQSQSKTMILRLNADIYNRDAALFDQLPWDTWTVDPFWRHRDAANNPVLAKFHLGKRDAFNRLMGKDWPGQSFSVVNKLASRLKYLVETKEDSKSDSNKKQELSLPNDEFDPVVDTFDTRVLMRRILELQRREQEMKLAELDYQLAIHKQQQQDNILPQESDNDKTVELHNARTKCMQDLDETTTRLQSLNGISLASSSSFSSSKDDYSNVPWLTQLLDETASQRIDENLPPYRGATGYAPMPDMGQASHCYASPFDMIKEIIEEQLNANVIGAILENTSLLQSTLSLGGAIILRRKTSTKTVTLGGEAVTVNDDEQEYGNLGITGGATVLVECDVDEAIGMALACAVPLQIESNIWERANVMAQGPNSPKSNATWTVRNALPLWKMLDLDVSVLFEGQASNRSSTKQTLPLRIPRTTMALFDRLFEERPPSATNSPTTVFPTDNPIQSLSQLDTMTNADKAQTLLQMSNFQDRLPRPRVLRQQPNALNELLVPLIDETVRRQYLIREAERSGNVQQVEELKRVKSKRQVAKEKAEEARFEGLEDVAQQWEDEAKFYESLRADVTQDEGSYSRFLDRDEWYERLRANQIKKLDKKKFGTLLDGIE